MSETDENKANRRHTLVRDEGIETDPLRIAEIEAANGLRQFDLGRSAAQQALERQVETGEPFRLRPSLLLALHRAALNGLSRLAGSYRTGHVSIQASRHQPPPPHLVAEMVEELCDYVNTKWLEASPIHIGAFVMWRLNWIHPFEDGNGRTSRMTSYVAMTVRSGFILPGTPTIPDQIVFDRRRYFEALEMADDSYVNGKIDVAGMEALLSGMLARQLAGFYRHLGGALPSGVDLDFF